MTTCTLSLEVKAVDSAGNPFVPIKPLKYNSLLWDGISKSDANDTQKLLFMSMNRLDFFALEPDKTQTPSIFVTITSVIKEGDRVLKTKVKKVDLVNHRNWWLFFLEQAIDNVNSRTDKRVKNALKVLT